MFTMLRQIGEKQRARSRERYKLEETISSRMEVKEEDLMLLKDLPKGLLKTSNTLQLALQLCIKYFIMTQTKRIILKKTTVLQLL